MKTLEWIFKGYIKAAIAININASPKLAIGPAIEILPFISSDRFSGLIWSEPGDANTNPKNDETTAITNPKGYNLNSARQPYFIATNLCPSSCNRDPITTLTMTIGKIERILSTFNPTVAIEKQKVSTTNAMVKFLSSSFVNSNNIKYIRHI